MVGNRDHGKVTFIAFRNDFIADVKEMNELIKVDKSTALFRRQVIDPKVYLDDQPLVFSIILLLIKEEFSFIDGKDTQRKITSSSSPTLRINRSQIKA